LDDINADVGTKLTPDSADFSDVLGPHGLNKRNEKGSQLLFLFQTMNLKIMNTYFTHKHHATHWSNLSKDWHMLDVWSTNDIKRVRDCRVWANNCVINSDHSAVIIEISLTSI
jgi:hypothetical protein